MDNEKYFHGFIFLFFRILELLNDICSPDFLIAIPAILFITTFAGTMVRHNLIIRTLAKSCKTRYFFCHNLKRKTNNFKKILGIYILILIRTFEIFLYDTCLVIV